MNGRRRESAPPPLASRSARAALIGTALAVLGLLAAGCGGGKPGAAVASLGTTSTSGIPSGTTTTAAGESGPQTGGGGPGGGQFTIAGGNVQQMSKLAACMRRNGVPNFPDPTAQGQISISSATGIDPGSARFQQAQQACRKDLPNGGTPSPAQQAQMRQHALAFSACMRSHGVPNFPDPQFGSGGRVSIKITAAAGGLDPQSPQFQAAQKACRGDLPGLGGSPRGSGSASSGGK